MRSARASPAGCRGLRRLARLRVAENRRCVGAGIQAARMGMPVPGRKRPVLLVMPVIGRCPGGGNRARPLHAYATKAAPVLQVCVQGMSTVGLLASYGTEFDQSDRLIGTALRSAMASWSTRARKVPRSATGRSCPARVPDRSRGRAHRNCPRRAARCASRAHSGMRRRRFGCPRPRGRGAWH